MRLVNCRGCQQLLRWCPLHSHEEWEIILQCVGEARSHVGDRCFDIKPGDVVVVPPGVVHNCEHEEAFGDMFVAVRSCEFSKEPFVVHDNSGDIARLMHMVLKLHAEKEEYYEEIIDSLIESILRYIKKERGVHIKYPFVNTLKKQIYENLSNAEFSLSEAIEASGYHVDYVRRCFREEVGCAPLIYLTRLRMELAKELLIQDSFLSVEDVAHRCGFADSFYFSTCFKKHNGIAPLSFRKQVKK